MQQWFTESQYLTHLERITIITLSTGIYCTVCFADPASSDSLDFDHTVNHNPAKSQEKAGCNANSSSTTGQQCYICVDTGCVVIPSLSNPCPHQPDPVELSRKRGQRMWNISFLLQ